MEDNIVLDRETFKVLAIDTRVSILKKLDERFQLTLTDLANELDMAPSTISEHLDKLVSAGLIQQIDKGMKWKYYRLTSKGKKILNPHEKKVWIVLSVSVLAMFAVVYRFLSMLEQFAISPMAHLGGEEFKRDVTYSAPVNDLISTGSEKAMEEANGTWVEGVTTTISQIPKVMARQIPYPELMTALLLVLIAGICVGYLIRKKRIL
jgi:DNA-binding transcriptional ArsR family regulator